MATASPTPCDVGVLGAGLVGLAMSLGCARQGHQVALRGAAQGRDGSRGPQGSTGADVRTLALNQASVDFLRSLGVWQAIQTGRATPIHDMHVVGDAIDQSIHFSSWQQAVPQLGWIVDAAALEHALHEALASPSLSPAVVWVEEQCVMPTVRLTVVAEGRESATRAALGARFDASPYAQVAVAARLEADRPHQHTARQWFFQPEVMALLPFDHPVPNHSYGLVWSVDAERGRALVAMPDAEFEQALAATLATDPQASERVGKLKLASARAQWPLALGRAQPLVGPGWALVGDAAHVIHPLAGQGLNLGLGDVAALLDVLANKEAWRGLGDVRLLSRYVRERAWALTTMGLATDGLQRLFAHPSPWAKELRNRGLGLVDTLSPLKQWLGREALG